jgi:AAA+ ATPase superfamily predicted ATPase
MKIIGRAFEQEELERYYESPRPEFIAVYGRRRVGKTYLIREFFKQGFAFYFTGVANSDAQIQLRNFNQYVKEYGGTDLKPARDWFEAFNNLKQLLQKKKANSDSEKQVVFIDEMPWLDTPKSGFLTALEFFWNSWASAQPEILLIVCGSATSWIINNLLKNHGGLHNRVTGRILLEPFSLAECEAYFSENGLALNRHQIVQSYMIFGGIPYYLNFMNKSLSLPQNIDRICFSKTANLKDEFEELYASLFKHSRRHIEIVVALSRKQSGLTREEIITATGLSAGGTLTKTLDELEQCGFIRRYRDFTRKKNGHYYQLIDFFTLFYLRFMKENSSDDEHFWSNYQSSSGYRAWSGYAFERVCSAHITQIKQKLGITGVSTDACSWRSKKVEQGAQIDLLIDRRDSVINLCEMKYAQTVFVIDKRYDEVLRNKKTAFQLETGTRKALHQTMITTYGIEHNAYWNSVQSEIMMDDLFV